jgi:uncharacterized protein (DUF433 family)
MSLTVTMQPVPLAADADGVLRVGSTRVTLDTVVAAYREGLTAETIVDQYPSLGLADVYAVISFFLSHQAEVDRYLYERQQVSAAVRKETEARYDPNGVRDRLLARQRRD